MGRRPADKRMAHLFCELLVRLQAVGLVEDNSFDFPLTQEELADTLGVSTVHVNRMLQDMRAAGLITLAGKRLAIHDVDGLNRMAEFDPNYLHLVRQSDRRSAMTRHVSAAPVLTVKPRLKNWRHLGRPSGRRLGALFRAPRGAGLWRSVLPSPSPGACG
jgi:DNA-binding transcriptional regulator LsrR (DeoR family)